MSAVRGALLASMAPRSRSALVRRADARSLRRRKAGAQTGARVRRGGDPARSDAKCAPTWIANRWRATPELALLVRRGASAPALPVCRAGAAR